MNPKQETDAFQRLAAHAAAREAIQAAALLHAYGALLAAEQICDAVPSRAQISDDPTLARLGRHVNTEGGYRRITEARRRVFDLLNGAGRDLADDVKALVDAARLAGQVVTVEQRPLQPLAMGHYETVVSVRPARGGA